MSEVCVCVLVGSHLLLSLLLFSDTWDRAPVTGTRSPSSTGKWALAAASLAGVPLPRKIDRHRARAAKLAVSLSFAPRCSQSAPLSSCPRLPMRMCCSRPWAPPPLTRPISNLPKHFLSSHTLFAWSPAPTRVFDDWQYCYALARISPLGPASFLLFPSPFFPRKTKPPTEPTDRRPRNPARIYLQDHGMRADGGLCVRRPARQHRRLSR